MTSPAIHEEIASLRFKAANGTMTVEDARRGIVILRAERLAMPPPKSSKKKVEIDTDDLLKELGI